MSRKEPLPRSDDEPRAREVTPATALVHLHGERWYSDMFCHAPMAMLEEDWTGAKRAVDALVRQGVTDLDRHVAEHPEFVREARATHRVVDANLAALRLFGFESKADFLARARELLPISVESNLQVYRAFATNAATAEGERTLHDTQGRATPILWRVAIPPPGGDFGRMVFYAVDVSRMKRAEEALIAAQAELARASRRAMLGEMVASIAHEINQPLGAIKLFVDTARRWLDRESPDMVRARRSIDNAYESAERASNIVSRVKSLVRRVPQEARQISLQRVVEESITLVERDARAHGVRIDFAPAQGLPPVRGDDTQIQQALVNLLSNAIQAIAASPRNRGRIRVAARRDDENAVIVDVEDDGPGLAPGHEELVFRPFFSTKADGMGLGLSICRTIIETQGGAISARRLDRGGACFTFSLPVFT